MGFSTTTRNSLLDAIFNNTSYVVAQAYVSLHTADPGNTGASEVTGGSYARQAGSFCAAASGALSNDANIDFTSMPAATVTHVGLWTAVSGGTWIGGGALTASKTTNSGDTLRIATGDLDASIT
jgi:hypothetical protein